MQVLEDCLTAAGDVGVLHINLHSNQHGLVTCWQSALMTLLDTGNHWPACCCICLLLATAFDTGGGQSCMSLHLHPV